MALNKKKVIITIAALAVIGGVGNAMDTTEEAPAPVTAVPSPAATTEAHAPATESSAPAEEDPTQAPAPVEQAPVNAEEAPAPAEEAAVQVADDADPADIETILSGFPDDGEGYVVLDSAAADHAEGTVVGLEVESPFGTTERGVWMLLSNGSVQAANEDTTEDTSAAWPVRKDARYALDDEVISVDIAIGVN
ncbi:hypothetical protein QNO00_13845 [Arthrobacter sp. zg-Y1219]|uniref:hypothetical protein n=1 Tax=Arthrobacter sp. zg-Y1219 TaxID=3049067 RepID=UPI0024C31221|nr:hypothetical protein [Arthrobacter sp. zg-Y1219]MDK1361343.1 hypothetical protein [Arthrobacter sp. zg-Y1219]